ncbi:MAG: membrane protein insertase YidC [Oscillospiraceae bacterium]|nr:membrane protein insertase YidC [Oscillospiraceae bacterium]
MWATITKPFAWLMVWLYEHTGNYGVAVILFALAVNLILTPFMAKSKKSMMRSTRLQPKIAELQRRHEGNPQKLNAEMQKLYREEGVNPMSGCLWSLIPFPILIALYSVIRQPITRMMFASSDVVTTLQDYFLEKGVEFSSTGRAASYVEIKLADLAHQYWSQIQTDLAGKIDRLLDLDFHFLGLNLGDQPQWNFFMNTDWSDASVWLPALGLFLIPFISALLSWASMKISSATNPSGVQNAQAESSMKTMNIMMPIMSIWICFVMPAAMGIYWIANSVFGIVRDFILTKIFRRQLDKEDAERAAQRSAREKELEAKRQETERLKAEGKTAINTNTSKKKRQAGEKQEREERKAALEKAERAARRERLGIKDAEIPASQVGNRRYARGRAYVPDRFTNPEAAAEATAAAALESEGASPIDESVPETVPELTESVGAVDEAVEAVEEAADEAAEAVEEAADEAAEAAGEAADEAAEAVEEAADEAVEAVEEAAAEPADE